MWLWFLGGYAAFIAVLLGAAAFVALFGKDSDHRYVGYRVLKLIWFGVTGAHPPCHVYLYLLVVHLI